MKFFCLKRPRNVYLNNRNRKEKPMKPKRYPYSGQKKKQPRDEIARLQCEIAVCQSDINLLKKRNAMTT